MPDPLNATRKPERRLSELNDGEPGRRLRPRTLRLVSLVIPAYNEQDCLLALAASLRRLMDALPYRFEVILVDDGSTDDTLRIMVDLRASDDRFRIIRLGRNFGNQAAFTAGIDRAQGDVVVLLNADLQDPPELVRDFIQKWMEGCDVVYAIREERREGRVKAWACAAFYRLLAGVSSVTMPLNAGTFGLMDRAVVDIIKTLPERNRYLPGIRSWVGFTQTGIGYTRPPRYAGTASGFRSLFKFALDGIFSFSVVPLNLISYAGFVVSAASFAAMLYYVYKRVIVQEGPPGFATLIVAIMFLGGTILLSLGVLGQYIARIYDEVRARPLYTVKETGGWSKGNGHEDS